MSWVQSVTLARQPVVLQPLDQRHAPGLAAAVSDGELWRLPYTSAPEPALVRDYIELALATPNRVGFAVLVGDRIVGTTSYHDILPASRRLEIGYTWYAASAQRTGVNTACKIALLDHAFDALGANVVGWRTDNINLRSQAAIERLGATRDGIIRGHQPRKDGSIRDTVLYAMTADQWPRHRARLIG